MWKHIVLFVALSGSVWGADAPMGDPSILPAGARLEELWNEGEFTEGVAVGPDGTVYFSDIAMEAKNPGRIMKFDPKTRKVSVHVADSGQSNGLFFDRKGRLLAVCGANVGLRALCEVKPDGKMKVLVDRFEGKRFNSPNDIVIHPSGRVYFSDPRYVGPEPLELPRMSVFRWDPDGSIHQVAPEIQKPNGLIFSPDAKTLYVADTDNGATGLEPEGTAPKPPKMTLNAYPVNPDGSLGPVRTLVDFGKGVGTDGMTTDTKGHIYCAVRKDERYGIVVFDPAGKEVAYIPTPDLPTNCTFGKGTETRTLYVTAGKGLYRITLAQEGYHPN